MRLTSPVIENNGKIPRSYAGEGEDISPPLEWWNVSRDAKEFALICEDPDAPKVGGREHPFVHWLIYNIPADCIRLPEALPTREQLELPVNAVQGRNSFGNIGYGGPMPPTGHGLHHYKFTLYALNTDLRLVSGLRRRTLLDLISDYVIDTAELVGTYERIDRQQPSKKSA